MDNTISIASIQTQLVMDYYNLTGCYNYETSEGTLFICLFNINLKTRKDIKHIEVAYIENVNTSNNSNSQYFAPHEVDEAIECFLARLNSKDFSIKTNHGKSKDEIESLNKTISNVVWEEDKDKLLLDTKDVANSLRLTNDFNYIFNNKNLLRISKRVQDITDTEIIGDIAIIYLQDNANEKYIRTFLPTEFDSAVKAFINILHSDTHTIKIR